MRRFIYASAIFMVSFTVLGQNYAGSFLTVAGGVGGGGFQYTPKGINSDGISKDKFGWNAKVGYSYYFTPQWGLSTGVGISYYRTVGKYNTVFSQNEFYNLGKQVDDDAPVRPTNYELRVRLANWEEEQKSYFFEIPLMVMFKHKFGETQKHGFYFGLGAKLQIPIISSTYRVLDGKNTTDKRLNVSGQYDPYTDEHGVVNTMPDVGAPGNPDLSYHGFGSIYNPGSALDWRGNLNLKMSIAGTAELGFLFGLHPRLDLMVGGYFDYGFNNIKKGNNPALLTAPDKYLPDANKKIGNGIDYNGMINSDVTNKVNLMAYGARIGLQIKLGRIAPKEELKLPDWMFEEDTNDDLEMLQKQLDEMHRLMQELLLLMDEEDEPAPAPEPEPEEFILVKGNVFDAETKEPLSATVEVIDARTSKLVAIVKSDEGTGAFKIPMTDFGRYTLEVHKEGYLYSSDELVVPSSTTKQVIEKSVYLNKIKVNQTIILKNIFFDTGKSTLKPASMTEIDRVYKLMTENPTMEIEISGHTDNVGSEVSNKKLSLARANVVVQELVKRGIAPSRMTSAGYGFDQPIAPNTTAEGRAQNRRTEFKITKM